jgi:hypothetical protein
MSNKQLDYEEQILSAHALFEKAAKNCATNESDFKDLDSQVKTKLAMAYGRTESSLPAKTREMKAMSDPEYVSWMESVSIKRKLYLKWRAKRDIEERRFDMFRSLLSIEKKKINML